MIKPRLHRTVGPVAPNEMLAEQPARERNRFFRSAVLSL
jgi:hypothetical protein